MANEPHLKLHGFRLWVRGYQFPHATDEWDAKWLDVLARYETHGAMVEAEGSFLMTTDIRAFMTALERLHQTLTGSASLTPLEPQLRIEIKGDNLGHLACKLWLTPDHRSQKHEFGFELDQTYLNPLINGCSRILADFPVRG